MQASAQMECVLNGRSVPVSGYSVQTTLLDYLRDQGLTGAKEGCAEGECGACTVLTLSNGADGPVYRAVNSCLLFLPMIAGREVVTVEALAEKGQLSEVQRAIAEAGGSQCGYCTPGFVMSLSAEHARRDRHGPCDPASMEGNLCRCTGYRPLRDAALSLTNPADNSLARRLSQPVREMQGLQYTTQAASFFRPSTLQECSALAVQYPDARWICGGTDLGVESNLQFRRWPQVISLEAIPELQEFSSTDERVRIGAALPLTEIAARWTDAPDAFRQWFPLFASPTLRNRATLGGNLATASPIGDAAPLLIALGATVHLFGPDGARAIPVESFFTGYRKTTARRGELISAVEIPKPFATFTRFYKVAKRRLDDISTVAAAMSLVMNEDGIVVHARFGFGGLAATPVRALAVEEAILEHPWNIDTVERAQAALDRMVSPISDHRGSAEYRREAAKSLIEKFWYDVRESGS